MKSIRDVIHNYNKYKDFTMLKIGHGFWERVAQVRQLQKKTDLNDVDIDDKIISKGFVTSNFYQDVLSQLNQSTKFKSKSFFLNLNLSPYQNASRYTSTPKFERIAQPILKSYKNKFNDKNLYDSMIFKTGCCDSTIIDFFEHLQKDKIVIVGPHYIRSILRLNFFKNANFISIPRYGLSLRDSILKKIEKNIRNIRASNNDLNITILFQAGDALTFLLATQLRNTFKNLKLIDCGLALSINYPKDLVHRPWYIFNKEGIQATYLKLNNQKNSKFFLSNKINLPKKISRDRSKIDFVELKQYDENFVEKLLSISRNENQFANRGPIWTLLKNEFEKHLLHNDDNLRILPCANGGIALEILMSLNEIKAKKKLKWAISSYSFSNLGVGRTSNSVIIDCDMQGLISIDELKKANQSFFRKFDGIIITNPFGAFSINDLEHIINWANDNNKFLIIDNAAGLHKHARRYKYESFSLHHTKPYGVGEGGLALVPKDEYETALSLIEYGNIKQRNKDFWINNGKLSDYSSAYILDRLNNYDDWFPKYILQFQRIKKIACDYIGLRCLTNNNIPKMSGLFIADKTIEIEKIKLEKKIIFGKYYKPLINSKNAIDIYTKCINIPSHPDMKNISDNELKKILRRIIG